MREILYSALVAGLVGLVVTGIHMLYEKVFKKRRRDQSQQNQDATPSDSEVKEYEQAKKIVYELGVNYPAVKEIAKIKGISKREVISECEEIIRRYNNKYH